MFWEKALGTDLFLKTKEYLANRKMSISQLVRLAVEEYLKMKGE